MLALTVRESVRWCTHVYRLRRPQQAISGRGEWPLADGSVAPTYDWTSRRRLAVCVFLDEQRLGRELCLRYSRLFSWPWCVHFGAASTEDVDT